MKRLGIYSTDYGVLMPLRGGGIFLVDLNILEAKEAPPEAAMDFGILLDDYNMTHAFYEIGEV